MGHKDGSNPVPAKIEKRRQNNFKRVYVILFHPCKQAAQDLEEQDFDSVRGSSKHGNREEIIFQEFRSCCFWTAGDTRHTWVKPSLTGHEIRPDAVFPVSADRLDLTQPVQHGTVTFQIPPENHGGHDTGEALGRLD
jgi:hypothetical protein